MAFCWSRQDSGMQHKPRSAKATGSLGAYDTYVLGFTRARTVTAQLENAAAVLTVATLYNAQAARTLALRPNRPARETSTPSLQTT